MDSRGQLYTVGSGGCPFCYLAWAVRASPSGRARPGRNRHGGSSPTSAQVLDPAASGLVGGRRNLGSAASLKKRASTGNSSPVALFSVCSLVIVWVVVGIATGPISTATSQ